MRILTTLVRRLRSLDMTCKYCGATNTVKPCWSCGR